jgi:hypothetical protein
MEGFEGFGLPEKATTASANNLAEGLVSWYHPESAKYRTTTQKVLNEEREKIVVPEKVYQQCCSCFKYTESFKRLFWCSGCRDLTGLNEFCYLCMNCYRLCGNQFTYVMKICGLCAI